MVTGSTPILFRSEGLFGVLLAHSIGGGDSRKESILILLRHIAAGKEHPALLQNISHTICGLLAILVTD